ncbi:HAMP domain-containing protein [Curvibacter sp. CHRR-16]|uniref:methyl-accepting chemotaxis protein n=1 Tax=Curvibacter sp. CHRR-16 TaxID=2835872 RepID=UPI001BD9E64D|nr:methyl-accepting chemotaxis protein [Curvibacter sp. CHRR-16]MBT0571703.1 HAMP domain-containing protein [Curvibacter sp. CHRR-16]
MNRIGIGSRLALGFAMVLLLTSVIAGISLWRLRDTTQTTLQMLQVPLNKERLVSDWYANVNSGVRRTAAIARSSDASLATFFAEDAAEASKLSSKYQKEIETLLNSDEEKAVFGRIGEARKKFVTTRDAISELKKQGNEAEALRLLEADFQPAAKAYLSGMQDFQALQRKQLDSQAQDIQSINGTSSAILLVLSLSVLGLGAVVSWVITRSITKPLHEAVQAAQRVAAGDLSGNLNTDRTDETGTLLHSLQDMQNRLTDLVHNVRGNAQSVSLASTEIAHGNLDLSQRTENQASAVQETNATVGQLNQAIRANADSAQHAKQLASEATTVANKGGQVVEHVVKTMRAIHQSSNKIGDIISVIDGIAFQTNILALNAAVEAARAGEQGRGFAVVASEVRSLAGRSAEAAKEIKTLITHSMEQVENGSNQVDQAGQTMQEIVSAIQKVSSIITEISAASAVQSEGVSQVEAMLTQMDQATQQNAALVEESAAAADSLKTQAQQLVEATSVFQLPVHTSRQLALAA